VRETENQKPRNNKHLHTQRDPSAKSARNYREISAKNAAHEIIKLIILI
jgi:hypothetical protein